MAKRYTRKQLRQPDEFITMSHRAASYVKDHAKLVAVALSITVVLVAVAWAWTWYSQSQARQATAMITRATQIYHQTIVPNAEQIKKDDDIPRFSSTAAKLKAADEELSKVMDRFGNSAAGLAARAIRAAVRYDQGRYGDAVADYKAYLDKVEDPRFRQTALEGLLYAYEADKRFKEALETINKMPREGEERFRALYHEGRVLAKQGKAKEAAQRFKQILDKATSATLLREAGQRLALLESR